MTDSSKLDPIEKRRMQNRIAQRNHRQRAKENIRKSPVCGKQPRAEAQQNGIELFNRQSESRHILTQEPSSNQSGGRGELQAVRRSEEAGGRCLGVDNSLLLSQSEMDLHKENEMMLDNALLKDLNAYSSSILPHNSTYQKPRTMSTSSGTKSPLRQISDPTGSFTRWSYNSLEQPFDTSGDMLLSGSSQISTAVGQNSATQNQLPTPQSLTNGNIYFPPIATSTWSTSSEGGGNDVPDMRMHRSDFCDTQMEDQVINDSDTLSMRYQYVIDHVKRAGFKNFDAMVSGYYTLPFAKNSTADRAQKVSRSKQLRSVLETLHKNSREWTKWEARGFQDQIVEAAEGIYVAELNQIPRDTVICRTLDDMVSPELDKGQLSAYLQRLYQNKVPNLWALLTELAGASSPQSADATILTLTLLHSVNMNSEPDLGEMVKVLLEQLL